MIKIGTCRICFVFKKWTYKIPLLRYGRIANYVEYYNYLHNPDIVAKTEYHWYGLKQETLKNIKIYTRYAKQDEINKEHQYLYLKKLNNKMQVGQDKQGKYKFFDYEDIKYYIKGK